MLLTAAFVGLVIALTGGGGAALASVPPGVAIVDVENGRLVAHMPSSEIKYPAEVITGDGSFWVWDLDG